MEFVRTKKGKLILDEEKQAEMKKTVSPKGELLSFSVNANSSARGSTVSNRLGT